jgi:hypothetical protein
MKADQQREPSAEQAQPEGEHLSPVIARRLLEALGRGGEGWRGQVRRLWEGHYRVNLLTGAAPASTRIVASYFLVVDDDGSILASTPAIGRPG